MPRLAVGPLVSPAFVAESWRMARTARVHSIPSATEVAVGLGLLAIYAGAAVVLTWRVAGRFDRWLDRPRLSGATGPARLIEEARC
jgi:hypothetical protein